MSTPQPNTDPAFWLDLLQRDPEVLNRLLGDLWKTVQGIRGDNRIPSLAELYELPLPEFSTEPFPEALRAKLGGRSLRWLAQETHITKSHMHRLAHGERPIVSLSDPRGSMAQIASIARALRVHPAYFAEWRRLWLMTLLDDAFELHPNLSIGIWTRFTNPRRSSAAAMNGR